MHLGLAACQPANGALGGLLDIFVGCGVFHALVKRHGNGGGEVGLDLHALLGSHENALAVDVRGKVHALLLDLTQGRQGEYLESARVGQDGSVPVHELVKSAHIVDQLIAGTDVQMVGVGKLDLAINGLELHGGYTALDGSAGTHVHKYRRLDVAVRGVKHASARSSLLFFEFEHNSCVLSSANISTGYRLLLMFMIFRIVCPDFSCSSPWQPVCRAGSR